jgi:hypothetical protein
MPYFPHRYLIFKGYSAKRPAKFQMGCSTYQKFVPFIIRFHLRADA